MVTGIKAEFESLDLAELCANRVRKNVSGSKSIKVVSRRRRVSEVPASYSFSARSENWASTPLSILNAARSYENLSTAPPRLIGSTEGCGSVRLEVICHDTQLRDVYRIMLSSGGVDIKRQYR